MPFGFITIGLIMIITGARGTQGQLGAQLQKDFTGDKNFIYWLIAIGIVGSIGYVDSLRTFSRLFLVLIVVVMVLKNGGFAQQLMQAVQQGPQKIVAPPIASGSAGSGGTNAASAPSSNPLSKVADFAKIAAMFAA